MGLFSRRRPYKRVVEGIARDAFHTDLLEAPGLASPPEELGGYMFNSLEGLAAVFFLTQRAFQSLHDPEKHDKARDYLAQLVFVELEESYSKSEMHSLVLPLLERRHDEYEAILDGAGEPGDNIRSLGSRMIANFIVESVDDVRANVAALFLFNRLVMEPAKKLKSMDSDGQIKW